MYHHVPLVTNYQFWKTTLSVYLILVNYWSSLTPKIPNQLEVPGSCNKEASASPSGSPPSSEFLKGHILLPISHKRRVPPCVKGNTKWQPFRKRNWGEMISFYFPCWISVCSWQLPSVFSAWFHFGSSTSLPPAPAPNSDRKCLKIQ